MQDLLHSSCFVYVCALCDLNISINIANDDQLDALLAFLFIYINLYSYPMIDTREVAIRTVISMCNAKTSFRAHRHLYMYIAFR